MGVIDMTGQKHNRLTVIERDLTKTGFAYWRCVCDCGKTKVVRGDHLRQGRVKSCGCYQKECGAIKGKLMIKNIAGANRIDITNQRFGNLVAIKMIGHDQTNNELWECMCDCGSKHTVAKTNLLNGHTKSCGCMNSTFEKNVAEVLCKNNIGYVKNATFDSCRFSNGALAKFDFYVSNKYIIECDGEQHNRIIGGRYDEAFFKKIKEYDRTKNEWCLHNNIPIIRLPYTICNSVVIDDLLLETTPYILKDCE